jgi:uncharacterized protein DUF4905
MKWFNKHNGQSCNPTWTYDANGMFWRMKISEDGRIICELRDPVKKETWFDCIEEGTGKVLWTNIRFDESWWIGLEDISDGIAYFHRFRKPDMPQHLGIIAVSLENGDVLWENTELTFMMVNGLDVYASREGFETRKYFLLNHEDGQVHKELGIDPRDLSELRNVQNEEYLFRNYRYPTPFDSKHAAFHSYRTLVNDYVDSDRLRGNLDLFQDENLLIIAWHETSDQHTDISPHLNQRFLAIEIDSNSVICSDLINEGVAAPAYDSFFIKDSRLFFVKNQQTLTAYQLPFGQDS